MAEVMREGDGFGKVLIELQRAGDAAGDRGDFHRVRESGAQVVARAVEKNLRLVLQPSEGARVNNAVAIALIFRTPRRRGFIVFAPAHTGAHLGVRREGQAFDAFEFLARAGHFNGASGVRNAEPISVR